MIFNNYKLLYKDKIVNKLLEIFPQRICEIIVNYLEIDIILKIPKKIKIIDTTFIFNTVFRIPLNSIIINKIQICSYGRQKLTSNIDFLADEKSIIL